MSDGYAPSDTVQVWDIVVRMFHWSLVAIFAALWLTSDDFVRLHELFGYALLVLLAIRVIWGFIGSKHARFRDFVKHPRAVASYLTDMRNDNAARFLGHNPAGGAMIIALLLSLAITAISGWMSVTDVYWGIRWVEILHTLAANATLLLVVAHIAGVVYASRAHNENLVRAMFTGRKRRD